MKNRILLFAAGTVLLAISAVSCDCSKEVTISKDVLMDKIKGGWAAQTIGCTYGGPTEFRYRSVMIPDSVEIAWPDNYVHTTMTYNKNLYDDVYMDLTFVKVFDEYGLDAPVDSFATAFANAGYNLWHANQQARYNILHGIMPPESGHWLNNPHADDIDFQIEADYAGLMAPGMVDAACHYSDGIGHIMNYGDGWYGGVYVAAMYSLAFVYDDINTIVTEALRAIPAESRYYKCMQDVIRWYGENPSDWKATWQLVEDNYGQDIGCPGGVFNPYNIDAVINSAYILIGLLYGEEDFEKTLEISTRCGQDSDCNPASAAGILATMQGYSNIPPKFLEPLKAAEDLEFAYTGMSLNQTYRMSYDQALKVVAEYGGKVGENDVTVKMRKIRPVRLEQGFEGLVPQGNYEFKRVFADTASTFEFDGKAVVLCGRYKKNDWSLLVDYVARIEITLDGEVQPIVEFPCCSRGRLEQIWFNYQLEPGHHTVSVRVLNPEKEAWIESSSYLVYD